MSLHQLKRALMAVVVAIGAIGATATPAEAATPCVQKLYRMNSRGECVRYIQALTNYQGGTKGSPALAVDGIWGSRTDRAVRTVQRTFGLTADGIVGPKTWSVLCAPQMGDDRYPGRVPASFPLWAARGAGCPGANGWYQ